MPKYRVRNSEGDLQPVIEAESMMRDGDWIMLTKSMPVMESRRVEKPRDPTNPDSLPEVQTVMVSTGRVQQTPIAYFYKPISVELVEPTAE